MTAGVKSKLDRAEVSADGAIEVRVQKVFVDGEGRETPLGFHRTVITPEAEALSQLDALDADLSALGAAPLNANDRDVVLSLTNAIHTEERRAAYVVALAAAAAATPF